MEKRLLAAGCLTAKHKYSGKINYSNRVKSYRVIHATNCIGADDSVTGKMSSQTLFQLKLKQMFELTTTCNMCWRQRKDGEGGLERVSFHFFHL